jgi:hypothetical protein
LAKWLDYNLYVVNALKASARLFRVLGKG